MSVTKVHVGWVPQQAPINKRYKTSFKIGVGGLPTKISVTKLPDKTVYKEGETFNPSGIIVHAYYEDDSELSTVP